MSMAPESALHIFPASWKINCPHRFEIDERLHSRIFNVGEAYG